MLSIGVVFMRGEIWGDGGFLLSLIFIYLVWSGLGLGWAAGGGPNGRAG